MKRLILLISTLMLILSACSPAARWLAREEDSPVGTAAPRALGGGRFEGRWLAAFNLEINTRMVQVSRPWFSFIIDLHQAGDQVIGSIYSSDANVIGTLHGSVDREGVLHGTLRLSWDTQDWESLTLRIAPDGTSGIGTAIYPAAANEWHFYSIHLSPQTSRSPAFGRVTATPTAFAVVPQVTAIPTVTGVYETPAPEETSTVSFKLEENANCRKGPNVFYDIVISLLADQQVEIVGRVGPPQWHFIETIWWLVRIPGSPEKCWVSGATGTVSGGLALLPVVQAPSLPNAPADFSSTSACPEQGNIRSVNLSWTGVPGATGYLLYRYVEDGDEKLIATLPARVVNFQDEARLDTYYIYELAAINQYGSSGRVAAWIHACE
jgi:hypothetical protein